MSTVINDVSNTTQCTQTYSSVEWLPEVVARSVDGPELLSPLAEGGLVATLKDGIGGVSLTEAHVLGIRSVDQMSDNLVSN